MSVQECEEEETVEEEQEQEQVGVVKEEAAEEEAVFTRGKEGIRSTLRVHNRRRRGYLYSRINHKGAGCRPCSET